MCSAKSGSSEYALHSTRSTVAIRLSIRLPVNIIFQVPVFFSGHGLVFIFLGRSGETPPQSVSKKAYLNSLPGTPYYHRTGSPAVSPGQTKLG
jgi:hypothetical protein